MQAEDQQRRLASVLPPTPWTYTFSYIIAAALIRLNHFSETVPPVYVGCACLMTPLYLVVSSQVFQFTPDI